MSDSLSELERRVRNRAREQLRLRIEQRVDALLQAYPGGTAGLHRVDTHRLAGLRAAIGRDDTHREPISVQITVHAARSLLIAALVGDLAPGAEAAAIDAVLAAAEREVARG